jgi:alpha,alpha-trehalase
MPIRRAANLTKDLISLPTKLPGINKPQPVELNQHDLIEARKYIAGYWSKLTRFKPKDAETLIGLPNPYFVPAFEKGHEFDFNEMYYWDSYFMSQALFDQKHKKLVMGMLDNLCFLFERYGIIPNASRTYLMGRSHPPLLTSFIWDVYEAYKPGKDWLEAKMAVAEAEYRTVWMGQNKPYAHRVYEGLSRYYDINYLQDLAEAESGWDMTPRFGRRALDYLPVDLNALLYKYETDLERTAEVLGKKAAAKRWRLAADKRAEMVDRLMWNDLRGLYYDYNYSKAKRGNVASLAAFFPLWAGMVNEKRAAKLVRSLRRFEKKGGLATTDSPQVNSYMPGAIPTQWAYPNGWAPLHFVIVKGLQRYGYHDDARRIALKWLKTNLDWFNKHHVFLEKYNVAQPSKPPSPGLYPCQVGFGWTNAVFERFCQEFIDNM